MGQARLLLSREPITPELIATLDPAEQRSIERLRAALAFGASLGLASTTSYRDLVGDKQSGLVHVVTAAPANQVEAITWWFPITGSVSYRGYFQKERADAFAAELAEEGHDTYVRPAPLYSTLGWFDDPVPRAVLSWPETELVDTFLHALVHQTVFVPGEIDYDEGVASFIAHHATLAFFAEEPELRRTRGGELRGRADLRRTARRAAPGARVDLLRTHRRPSARASCVRRSSRASRARCMRRSLGARAATRASPGLTPRTRGSPRTAPTSRSCPASRPSSPRWVAT